MTQTHSATVATGGATKVSLPTDDLDELLETAAVTVENGGNPTWLSGSGSESLGETTADRRETARRLDTTVSFTVSVLPADAPDPIPDLVAQFESGDLPVAEMSTETLHANLDAHDVTEYRLAGTLSSSGDVRFREFAAFYETPWSVRDTPVADFEGEDDRLVLSHREVVENAPESMYLPAEHGDHAHRSAVTAIEGNEGDFREFLWAAVVEAQVTDGWWENAYPPYDFTELLGDEDMTGDLMYYGYRFHGWDYSVEQLRADLDDLTGAYGDIPF